MSVVITDLGADVQFAFTGTIASENFIFNKATMRVKQGSSLVYVTNSDSFQEGKDNKVLELSYLNITSPVYASNDALYEALKVMIDDNAGSVADRAYDEAGDQDVVFVTNQDSEKWTSPEHLVSFSAQGAATLRYVIPMRGYKDLCPHWKFSNSNAGDTITMTIWSTNNSAADDSSDDNWVDRSGDWLSKTLTINNGSIEFMEEIKDINALKVMIKLVVASAGDTNAADIFITKKAL
jgi:hypothetical protein